MIRRLFAGLFWGAVLHVGYVYLVFPVLAIVRGRLWRRPVSSAAITPTVIVLIAAHNEEHTIAKKVTSVLASDYPSERLRVLVASDGSTDETLARVTAITDDRVAVLDLPRGGKAATLNRAMERIPPGVDVIVMSDANSLLDPAAIRALVRPLADPSVGAVAGDQRYRRTVEADASGEESYWNIDRQLKLAETMGGSAIAATGALYAIRRALVRPIPGHVNDDFYTSASVIGDGYRLVFEPAAIAYEPPAVTMDGEFRRKVRIITRALATEIALRHLADPRRTGFYAITFVSHKVLRHLLPISLVGLAIATPLLAAGRVAAYRLALAGQVALYALAAAGLARSRAGMPTHRILTMPAFFVYANAAALVAVWNTLRGRRITEWTTTER